MKSKGRTRGGWIGDNVLSGFTSIFSCAVREKDKNYEINGQVFEMYA